LYSDVQVNKGGTTEDFAFVLYSRDGSFFLREGMSQAEMLVFPFGDAREPEKARLRFLPVCAKA